MKRFAFEPDKSTSFFAFVKRLQKRDIRFGFLLKKPSAAWLSFCVGQFLGYMSLWVFVIEMQKQDIERKMEAFL